jgi:hypothetical protein
LAGQNARRRGRASCTSHRDGISNRTPKPRRVLAPAKLNKFMKVKVQIIKKRMEAKMGWALLWLLGVPIPVLLILFLLRGCT